jgi:signal transduction histidine kinase
MKSRVEELIDEVKDEARGDMNRVRKVVDHLLPRPTLETELLEEMAGALARVERRLRDAVELLRAIDPSDRERWRAQRAICVRCLRDLVIQRESLRFPRDPHLADRYGIPPPR